MRPFIIALFASLLAIASPIRAAEMQLVLELVTLSEGEVTHRVALYANDIDPNSSSVEDRYKLTVDGQGRRLPREFLHQLDSKRRAYSYDQLSGGIDRQEAQAGCLMYGPSEGEILRTRYLTYRNDRIISSEMRDVLSEPRNCLFSTDIHPVRLSAHLAATKALAILQTLRLID